MATRGARTSGKKAAAKRGRREAAPPPGEEATGSAAAASRVASRVPALAQGRVEAAKCKFQEGILSRGEAVPAGVPLPPGATHEIAGQTPDGRPKLKRRRFSTR
jgi:hypothetical protein